MSGDRSFVLDGFRNPVRVVLKASITEKQLLNFPAFVTWKSTLRTNLELQYQDESHQFHDHPFELQSIEVQSVDWILLKLLFVKLKATITNDENKELPGIIFLRNGSVAMLMILRPKDTRDERWVVMTEQPRIPAGCLAFKEIPAGMIEDQTFGGTAAREIEEETGFRIPVSELIDMTKLALRNSRVTEELKDAMYPSPGGCDEFIPIFLWEKEVDRQEIEDLKGKLTGQRRRGELITLRVSPYEDLWRDGARDAKTLAAWALYEGLNRAGIIKEEILKRQRTLLPPDDATAGAEAN
jgi:ADP-sugar diphosphatase